MTSKFFDVSYSSLGTLRSCARKFQANKLFKRPERHFESIAMSAGQALHAGYQDYLIDKDIESAMWTLGLTYPHIHCWETSHDRSFEACISTLDAMIASNAMLEYELAEIECPDGVIRPAIEVPFAIVMEGMFMPDGRQIRIIGYMDAVMRKILTGSFKTLDIKTHRDNKYDRTANYKNDTQQLPYGLVLEHFAGHAIDSFEVLYFDAYIDILNPRITPYVYNKTHADVQDWLFCKIGQLQELQRMAAANWFPRSDNGCTFYNKPCALLDTCGIQDDEVFQKFLLEGRPAEEPKEFEPWITARINLLEIGIGNKQE